MHISLLNGGANIVLASDTIVSVVIAAVRSPESSTPMCRTRITNGT